MGLFNNRQQAQALSQRQLLENKYTEGRRNIYILLAMTVINLFLLVTNSGRYFLFSASVPYLIADLAMALCGKYPPEYYGGEQYALLGDGVFYVMMGVAALLLVMYLLCGIFSGKGRKGWLVFALVLFVLDSAVMVWLWVDMGCSMDSILDLVIHAMVLYSLYSGVSAANKLAKLPPEEEPTENFMDAFVQSAEETAATSTEE